MKRILSVVVMVVLFLLTLSCSVFAVDIWSVEKAKKNGGAFVECENGDLYRLYTKEISNDGSIYRLKNDVEIPVINPNDRILLYDREIYMFHVLKDGYTIKYSAMPLEDEINILVPGSGWFQFSEYEQGTIASLNNRINDYGLIEAYDNEVFTLSRYGGTRYITEEFIADQRYFIYDREITGYGYWKEMHGVEFDIEKTKLGYSIATPKEKLKDGYYVMYFGNVSWKGKEYSVVKVDSNAPSKSGNMYSKEDGVTNDAMSNTTNVTINGNVIYPSVSDWAKEEVENAYENGLVPEYFEGKDLTKKISRAEFAAVAVQTYEEISNKTVSAKSMPFDDISGHELKKDIGKAYGLNVAIGVSDDEFEPDSDITREQLATMLCRVIKKYRYPDWSIDTDDEYYIGGSNTKKFDDDYEISDYAKDSVYYMYSVGIINGIGNNKFAPKNSTSYQKSIDYATATREQAIIMANRIYERKASFSNAGSLGSLSRVGVKNPE